MNRIGESHRSSIALVAAAGLVALVALSTPPAAALDAASTAAATADARSSDAAADPGRKIMVSLQQRRLWLVEDGDTLFSAPIAIGKGGVFRYAGRTYHFSTPTGHRVIEAKHEDPNWIPPDWHYYEKAVNRGLEPVHLEEGDLVELSDGTFIEVRNKEVGRINRWGNWFPFTPGSEIIFDGMIYIPPLGSPQRMVPDALGPVKLSLGGGYLIHGTHRYNRSSIGSAASHGCIRMHNDDVIRLSALVQVGTPVHIY
ncbi:MAG: L,D-transpeptidase family protein [Gemmatimonadetes bacterium]|nr:L,D-transpeptidase family protein [Gemmatimonadota bacterium]